MHLLRCANQDDFNRRLRDPAHRCPRNEPNVDAALIRLPNVTLTPHLGSAVVEVREAVTNAAVDNILAIPAGRRPPNIVNPEVLS
jgi:gluconate 2-dehydrogenase